MKQKKLSEIKVGPLIGPEVYERKKKLEVELNREASEIFLDALRDINFEPWKVLVDYSDELYEDVLRPFIIGQMVFNNYELTKNGKRLLVTHNHQNFVNKNDIIAYIDDIYNDSSRRRNLTGYLNQIVREYSQELFNSYIAEEKSNFLRLFVAKHKNPKDDFATANLKDIALHWREDLYFDIMDELKNDDNFKNYMNKKLLTAELFEGSKSLLKKKIAQKFKPSTKDTSATRLIKELVVKAFIQLLREYPESKIVQLLNKWGIKPGTPDEKVARQLLTRFEEIKGGIDSKRTMLPTKITSEISDLKNIDLYSFEQLVMLIKAYPESEEKIKKEAVKQFVEKDFITKQDAQSYVARFMNRKADLKHAASNGIEGVFTKEQVLDYIPKRLQQDEKYLDPRNYTWNALEQMLDTLFPSRKQVADGEEINTAESSGDKIYDKGGIEVYKCDEQEKCIVYNPTVQSTKRKKYSWCVAQPGSSMYDSYRLGQKSPTFYFIFDRNKTSEPNHNPFIDKWHAIALQVNVDGTSYVVTNANNDRDAAAKTWEDISSIVPPDTWSRIENLQEYIKPVPLSNVERARKIASGRNLSLEEFKEITEDEKRDYVLGKGSKDALPPDILEILPLYKLNYEGRTTTLANIAIDAGQTFPFYILKKYESLARRYAIFRSRHNLYGQKAIPVPLIKYLDDNGKQKYLDTFKDNVTFEYIEEYFGDNIAKKYVDDQAKVLNYLPPAAYKYITDAKTRKLYEILSKSTSLWKFSEGTNADEDALGTETVMYNQQVMPIPYTFPTWKSLNPQERQILVQLVKNNSGKSEYIELLYALPVVVEDQNTNYVLVVPKAEYTLDNGAEYQTTWILADMNGNEKAEVDAEETELNGHPLIANSMGSPHDRILQYSDLKIK